MSAISSSLTMPLPTSNVQWMLYLLTTCLRIQLAPTSPCLVSIWTCWMSNRSWCMDLMGRFSGPRSRWRLLGSQMGSPNPFTLRVVPKWGCSRGWHTFWRSTDRYENVKNLHAQCPDFKCKPSALDCCCCCLFFNQLNFWDVKTLLEAFCREWKSYSPQSSIVSWTAWSSAGDMPREYTVGIWCSHQKQTLRGMW